MPRVGKVFFTSAYLWVNSDDKTFTIWEANPTTAIDLVSVADSKIQEVCNISSVILSSSTNQRATNAAPTATANKSSVSTSSANKGLSGGSLGGIVAGTLVILSVLGTLVPFYWVRIRPKQKAKSGKLAYDPSEAPPQYAAQTPMAEMMEAEPSELKGD